VLDTDIVDRLFADASGVGYQLEVDLAKQLITTKYGERIPFEIEPTRKHRLLNGLDDIGLTLQHADAIHAYEERRREEAPWLFSDAA
jgi:3-isopropylmalate/(R)-2-methylmalate dehydratase small subunit